MKISTWILLMVYFSLVSIPYLYYCFFISRRASHTLIKRNWKLLLLDNLIYIVLALIGISAYLGILYNVPKISSPFTEIITQFIGTVLAVFFSLSVFPFQNLINTTSFAFIKRITENKFFIRSIILLILIFLSVSGQNLLGYNNEIIIIQFIYLIVAVFTFLLILQETFRLFDIRNVIYDNEIQAIGNLNLRWNKVASEIINDKKKIQVLAVIKSGLVIDTKRLIEPIFITTKKYIINDQPEVVLSGLNAIVNITSKYISLFKFSVQDKDQLLVYLIERFIDLKKRLISKLRLHYTP